MNYIPSPAQRIAARQVARTLLADAIRSGAINEEGWVGSADHFLRSALIDADYRDGFPDSYPGHEVEAARRLIISIGSDALAAQEVK